ncbi:MAG: peptidoglycan DD-metalloendopeptidase family protein, partial [Clostridia bacterium]|nr:peptidoglycan DD-metalloendopeptidase family protein [Clostridia bacterium]
MKNYSLFHQNDMIKKGDIIGYVGNTGNAQGYHLHMEANNINAA